MKRKELFEHEKWEDHSFPDKQSGQKQEAVGTIIWGGFLISFSLFFISIESLLCYVYNETLNWAPFTMHVWFLESCGWLAGFQDILISALKNRNEETLEVLSTAKQAHGYQWIREYIRSHQYLATLMLWEANNWMTLFCIFVGWKFMLKLRLGWCNGLPIF